MHICLLLLNHHLGAWNFLILVILDIYFPFLLCSLSITSSHISWRVLVYYYHYYCCCYCLHFRLYILKHLSVSQKWNLQLLPVVRMCIFLSLCLLLVKFFISKCISKFDQATCCIQIQWMLILSWRIGYLCLWRMNSLLIIYFGLRNFF